MLITNGKIITWGEPNQILEKHAILIKEDRIQEIASQDELKLRNPQVKELDAGGKYVLPGNICAHTHFYGAFARGMPIPGQAAQDFPEILKKLWWPLDKALTLEDIRLSALVCLVDAIKHGTTTLIDHHASPNAIQGSLDVIADAVNEAGNRAVLCYEVTDRDGDEKTQASIQENLRFIKRTQAEHLAEGRVAASFGLHASLTLSNQTLEYARQVAPQEIGFHLHVAEHEADQNDSLAKSGLRVVHRLAKHGILGPRTIIAHAVHVDAQEITLLAESRTWVSHQPRSNMNNGVGVAPVESLLHASVRMCMGTDGFPHTMWEEWKFAYLLPKVWQRDPRCMPANQIINMAVYNNAALAGTFFPQAPLGVLSPGAFADMIFVDYHPFTPLTTDNLPWHMIYGFHESMVSTTIVAGKVLMHERKLVTIDEEAVCVRARQQAAQAWKRYAEIAQ